MNPKALREEIEKIEEAYEYMLAYAAQGRLDEGAGPDGAHIRDFLEQFRKAASSIEAATGELSAAQPSAGDFFEGFKRETAVMKSVLNILLSRKNISSEAIDNTNGLISARAYLTSLFFIDKVVLSAEK